MFVGKTTNFAIAAGDAQVRLFNTNGGNVRNFGSRGDFMYCVAVSPDGSVVAAGGQDGAVAPLQRQHRGAHQGDAAAGGRDGREEGRQEGQEAEEEVIAARRSRTPGGGPGGSSGPAFSCARLASEPEA